MRFGFLMKKKNCWKEKFEDETARSSKVIRKEGHRWKERKIERKEEIREGRKDEKKRKKEKRTFV